MKRLQEHHVAVALLVERLVWPETQGVVVVDDRRRHVAAVVTRQARPQREVRILHVEEECFVEAAQLLEEVTTHGKGRARHRCHFLRLAERAGRHPHAAAEREARVVHIVAAGVNAVRLLQQQDLRSGQPDLGRTLQRVNERVQPTRRGHGIGVEESQVLTRRMLHCQVVPAGEPEVDDTPEEANIRKGAL